MSETKHTPTPWYIGDMCVNPDDGVPGEIAICAKVDRHPHGFVTPAVAIPFGDHSAARAICSANAALIVRAVNSLSSHEARIAELLEVLREAVDLIEGDLTGTEWKKACAAFAAAARAALHTEGK